MPVVVTTKPFVSQAQAGWAFANKKPFAKRWARQTGPYKRLPYKKVKKDIVGTVSTAVSPHGPGGLMSAPGMGGTRKRKKAFTLDQLESFVCSPHYDPATAAAIASGIPVLPSLKGEQIAPGITRIHGNLCNVHGRYGKCPGASVTPPPPKPHKGRRPRKAAKPKVDRTAQHAQNRAATLTGAGYSPADQAALTALRNGTQPTSVSEDLLNKGLVEQASDGSYRMTASGRALLNAADQGDAGRVRDVVSSATDRTNARNQRRGAAAVRQQAAATRHAQAQANREQARQTRLAKQQARQAAAKKPAKAGGGGGKTPAPKAPKAPAQSAPAKAPPKARATPSAKPFTATVPKPAKVAAPTKAETTARNQAAVRDAMAQADQGLAPGGFDNLIALGNGKEPDKIGADGLISMGMAERGTDGTLRLTSAGRSAITAANRGDAKAAIDVISRASEPPKQATTKVFSFRVFKDATGRARWVAQSSTAYQDRDHEIVSTKALEDDCRFADNHHVYGPLRWWHTPGLDLGDCDFNAMHGRILIESGTFRSPLIAQKVAQAADTLEISLGFLHLPTEPDAAGVFHHIRRFERSLVPKGKASNRFTAFRIKEHPMFDPIKVAALKQLGFSDSDIQGLQTQAEATEKAADAQQIAFKADEPATEAPPPELPDLVINGVTYKAFGAPKMDASAAPPEGSPEEEAAESPEEEQQEMDAGEGDAGGLTLSPEDIQAIGQAVSDALTTALGPLVSTMDLTNKIGSHMNDLKTMMGGYQTKKDAGDAEKAEQIAQLQESLKSTQSKLDELLGLQPEVSPRASQAPQSILNPFNSADNALLASIKDQVPADQMGFVDEFADLRKNLFSQ